MVIVSDMTQFCTYVTDKFQWTCPYPVLSDLGILISSIFLVIYEEKLCK